MYCAADADGRDCGVPAGLLSFAAQHNVNADNCLADGPGVQDIRAQIRL